MASDTRSKTIAVRCGVPYIFKASYDKANRTSLTSFRGPGLDVGLGVLARVRREVGVPVLTDIHEPAHADAAAAAASTCCRSPPSCRRQTDLHRRGGAHRVRGEHQEGAVSRVRLDVRHAIGKVTDSGNMRVLVTERGFSFGYNNLVVDMRAFPMMRELGWPVIFDVTHSLQLPGGGDGVTAGLGQYIEPLASAGVGAGVDGVFLEVHEEPARAMSDAQNAIALDRLEPLLRRLARIDAVVKDA